MSGAQPLAYFSWYWSLVESYVWLVFRGLLCLVGLVGGPCLLGLGGGPCLTGLGGGPCLIGLGGGLHRNFLKGHQEILMRSLVLDP